MERSSRPIVQPPKERVIAHRSGSVVRIATADERVQIPTEEPPPQAERKVLASVVRRSVTVDDMAQVALERRPSPPDGVHPYRPHAERNVFASVVRSTSHPDGVYPDYPQVEHKAIASEGDVSLPVQSLMQQGSRVAELSSGRSRADVTLGQFLFFCGVAFTLGIGTAMCVSSRAAANTPPSAVPSGAQPPQTSASLGDLAIKSEEEDNKMSTTTDDSEGNGYSRSKSTGQFSTGDKVKIIKEESRFEGQTAVITEMYGSPVRIRVRMDADGAIKSYFFEEIAGVD
jgi:hypothetical protein